MIFDGTERVEAPAEFSDATRFLPINSNMQAFITSLSSFAFVTVLFVGAAACVAGTLVVCRRARLDVLYDRVRSRLHVGWGLRSVLSLLSLSMLTIVATWLLGAVDPATYLAPGPAALVYSALLLSMPVYAVAMPGGRQRAEPVDRAEESRARDEARRAA
jgi:hypothetical protein